MINGFIFNGLGAVFVINLLFWMEQLALTVVVFGLVIGAVMAMRGLFNLH